MKCYGSPEGSWRRRCSFPGEDFGCQGSFRAKQEDGNGNRKFWRVAASPVHAAEKNLKELVSVLIVGLKKANSSWENHMHRTQLKCHAAVSGPCSSHTKWGLREEFGNHLLIHCWLRDFCVPFTLMWQKKLRADLFLNYSLWWRTDECSGFSVADEDVTGSQ